MTTMYRVRTVWTGLPGMPGYTNHYFGTTDPLQEGAAAARNAVSTLWQNIHTFLPLGLVLTIENAVALIEDTDGLQSDELTDPTVITMDPPSGTGGYSAPVGASIGWGTATFRAGRRVKGRTYVVPLASSCFDVSGSLTPAVQSGIQSAADAMIAHPSQFVIWSRPTGVAANGIAALVTSATVKDFSAVLRSRRD